MTRISPGHDAGAASVSHFAASHFTASHFAASHFTASYFATQAQPGSGVSEPLRMEVQVGPGTTGPETTTVRVVGEIDLATAPLLRKGVMAQLAQASRQLVLDLQKVDFLGSSGLAVLVEIRNEALRRGIGLRLVTTSRAVLRPLTATGLIELFDVEPSGSVERPPRQGGG